MNIHCSACGAALPTGAKYCPACALPLTVIAMPTPAPVRRRKPIWPYFVAAFVLFWIVAYTSDQIDRPKQEAAAAARQAAAQKQNDAHWTLVRSLSTPQLFQAKCGRPLASYRGIRDWDGNFDAAYRRNAVTLAYRMPNDLVKEDVMDVIFVNDKDTPTVFREHFDDRTHAVMPYDGLLIIGCIQEELHTK